MCKLISANFLRMKKNSLFYIFLLGMVAFGTYMSFAVSAEDTAFQLDKCLFENIPINGIICAVFISLFAGTEYSDGTIRNKLIVGHSRFAVYISHLVVCSAATIILSMAYLVAFCVIGIVKGGTFSTELQVICFYIICAFLVTVANVSLMLMISLSINNKAYSAVICVILAVATLTCSSVINQRLSEPEIYENYISVNELGIPTEVEKAPNPNYVEGRSRQVLEFLDDALPSGQAIQLVGVFDSEDPEKNTDFLYSLAFIVISTGIGLVLFKKKDIK